MPVEVRNFVLKYFSLDENEMVEGGRYHNLKDLGTLPNPSGKKLVYDNWPAIPHPDFSYHSSIFKIINSIPGLKVHAKIAMVKRYEEGNMNIYSLLATGNFNETTGRFYTDHVFFTNKKEFSDELQQLFLYLQSRLQPEEVSKLKLKHLLVSQFNMIKRFNNLIDKEIENAKNGLPAHIIIKVNNLQERAMIEKLYVASNAGVKIELIVRSICCLAPGIGGQSENITIRRIVDRYLEHARIFYFHNTGDPEVFMGSADWMSRNLHSRIEVIFPIYYNKLKQQLIDILQIQLNDTLKAVLVKADYTNEKIFSPEGTAPIAAQETEYNYVKNLNSDLTAKT
jgi:polyphosphate kinase